MAIKNIKKGFLIMKKLVATIAACACLGLSTINASAAESTGTSGGVDLDPILKKYREIGAVQYAFSPNPWQKADGGSFRTYWDGNTHGSQFDHSYKKHGVSASNSNSTRYSLYEDPGDRAEIWIYSTNSGNRGNWTTDNWGRG